MTRCQITIRTSLSAFKEIDFIFIEKKGGFDSQRGVVEKKSRLLRNKVIDEKRRRRKRGEWEEEARDKMKR